MRSTVVVVKGSIVTEAVYEDNQLVAMSGYKGEVELVEMNHMKVTSPGGNVMWLSMGRVHTIPAEGDEEHSTFIWKF